MKLVIDRSKWLHGEGETESRLLRAEDGKMCCLGFFAIANGGKERQIRGRSNPVETGRPKLFPGLIDVSWNAPICHALMRANDTKRATDDFRENRIKALFKKIGVSVRFKGKY